MLDRTTEALKIIKNRPLPPNGKAKRGNITPLLREMQIGDSLDIPVEGELERARNSIKTCASNAGRSNGAKFETRKLDEKTIGIWRVA